MRPTMSSSSALPLSFSASIASRRTHQLDRCSVPSSTSPSLAQSQWRDGNGENPVQKPRTIRYRLSQLCREGQPHLARQLFDTIPQPTTVLWNAVIIGFISNNMPHEAIILYSRMKSKPFTQCDSYTYSSTLKACALTRNLKVGKAIHSHILRSHVGNPSRIVCNSLLNMYATCLDNECEMGSADLVRRVFDTMPKRNVVAWNTLISWYAKVDRYFEAVVHFLKMMKMGIKPTVVSFVNVFPAVSGMGDLIIADVLYALLLKMGSDYYNDMFAISSAISMYADIACLEASRKVFENSLEKNIEVWNTMIGGYVQNNRPTEALEIFIEACEDGVSLDDVTFISALNAASQLQQLDVAKQLHAYILKNALVLNVIVLNAIIVMYSRCDFIESSSKIFSRMVERDVVSWNTMVSAYVQNGLNNEGLMLVHEMQRQGFLIDQITATALLSAASNLRNHEIGKQTHAYLLRHNIEFVGMETYLIDMYAKSGLIEDAQVFFGKYCSQGEDQTIWNAMIAGNCQNGLSEQALITFHQMLLQKVAPNAVTIASILPACNLIGSVDLGKKLHSFAIRRCLHENVFVHSALIDMYSKLGIIGYAENAFAHSFAKNSVTYTNMILGYGQHGMGEKALALFSSMREYGIQPDSVTIVAILSACSYSGLVKEGFEIFNSMEREYKVVPSHEHYCCVVDMLGRVGRVSEAYEFIKGLGEECNNIRIWGSLLASCRTHGEHGLGKVVAEKLTAMEGGLSKTSGYHVLLSNIYAEEGNWGNVNRVRKEMQEKGVAKETGRSWIDVDGYMNCFTSKDQKHSKRDEIYAMLDVLAIDMKNSGYQPCLISDMVCISES